MTGKPTFLLLTVLLTSLTVGIRAQEKKEEPDVNPPRSAEAVKTSQPPVGAPVDPSTYKLGAEDVIFVKVWREQELSGPILVRPDGKISMPLIGELQAEGLTPEQLAASITESLEKVMQRPEVFVMVQQVNSKSYYISGEVNRTGKFPLITPTTVLEALSSAGGLREFANGKKIVIIRGDQRLKFNYKQVIEGKHLEQNIQLQNGDHIYVP